MPEEKEGIAIQEGVGRLARVQSISEEPVSGDRMVRTRTAAAASDGSPMPSDILRGRSNVGFGEVQRKSYFAREVKVKDIRVVCHVKPKPRVAWGIRNTMFIEFSPSTVVELETKVEPPDRSDPNAIDSIQSFPLPLPDDKKTLEIEFDPSAMTPKG